MSLRLRESGGSEDAGLAQPSERYPVEDLAVVERLIRDGHSGGNLNVHDRLAVLASIRTIGQVREVGLAGVLAVTHEATAGKDRLGGLRVRAVVKVVDADDVAIRVYDVTGSQAPSPPTPRDAAPDALACADEAPRPAHGRAGWR